MIDAVGKSSFTYQNFGPFWSALASEDGPWLSDKLSRTYYANGLPYAYAVEDGWSGSYGYDNLLRLHTLTSPAGTFTYNYANTTGRQISSLALPGGSSIAYGYDPAGLLTSTALKNSANTVLDSYGYTYDAVGWRTNVLRADGTQVAYGYDNIGQLTTATGFESGGAARLNENFGYTYDPAGNLTQRVNDTLSQTFTPDPANELTNVLRTTSVMTVAGGLTNSPTSLSINGKTANIYGDKTFAATNVALVDGLNTFTNILTISGSSFTNLLTKNLPASANLSYDLNGNMTSDGLHGFEYDCANQLTRITQTNKFKSEFVYDGFGRRRIRREYAWTGTWAPTSETHYVYDGMLVIQERDGNNATQVSYTRGLDLSGDLQDAGGIGGLLARTDANSSAFYHTDGNGNVTAMINSSGTVLAKYLYDSYGNILNKSGSLADVNLYRFSSKEAHVPTGLYYYGFRYYVPNLQRWINRDPVGETGGMNRYQFVCNSPNTWFDGGGLLPDGFTPPPLKFDPGDADQRAVNIAWLEGFWESLSDNGLGHEGDTLPDGTKRGPLLDGGPFPWWLGFPEPAGEFPNCKLLSAPKTPKLLTQFNSIDSLIQNAGKLQKLKGGKLMGTVKGNGPAIFNDLSKGGTTLPSGYVLMGDGTIMGTHIATSTGEFTIDINQAGKMYKIRVTP